MTAIADMVCLPVLDTLRLTATPRKGRRGMGGEAKRRLSALAHSRFREVLRREATNAGVVVLATTEEYTTAGCGFCGRNTRIGMAKVHRCKNPDCISKARST